MRVPMLEALVYRTAKLQKHQNAVFDMGARGIKWFAPAGFDREASPRFPTG